MFPSIPRILDSATSYFHLPIEEDPLDESGGDLLRVSDSTDLGLTPRNILHISATRSKLSEKPDTAVSHANTSPDDDTLPPTGPRSSATIQDILARHDLYEILGLSKYSRIDRLSLRRAYLSRSKACHPDKFPDSPEATTAFQKVTMSYEILSKPSSKRVYDARSTNTPYDLFSEHPHAQVEETFRGVVLGVFNDFIDGDLDTIRTLLRAASDFNPSLRLGDEGIDAVLNTLESIRERALTCRTCILTLHTEVSRLLEVQYAFRQLSYFNLKQRSRLSIQLARIAINLPIALERALQEQREEDRYGHDRERAGVGGTALLNRHVYSVLLGFVVVLEGMERILA